MENSKELQWKKLWERWKIVSQRYDKSSEMTTNVQKGTVKIWLNTQKYNQNLVRKLKFNNFFLQDNKCKDCEMWKVWSIPLSRKGVVQESNAIKHKNTLYLYNGIIKIESNKIATGEEDQKYHIWDPTSQTI